MKLFILIIFIFFLKIPTVQAFYNERIAVQGFLKTSGAPLNNVTGFPMRFMLKRNSTTVWCQTSPGNIPVVSGILSSILSGTSNCQSLSNTLDSNLLSHLSNTDVFTIDVTVDVSMDGFGSTDDASFSGIDILPTPFAISAKSASTADTLTGNLAISAGGTGATTAALARTNLGLGTIAVINTNGSATDVLYGNGSFGALPGNSLTGDVTGTLSTNTVTKIRGRNVSATAPINAQVLAWNNSTTQWEPQTAASAPVASVAGKTGAVTLVSADISDAASANTASRIVTRDASGNFSAGTISANLTGNATNVSGTVALANGGTGGTTAVMARANLGAAASGINTDITSITGSALQSTMMLATTTAGGTTAYTITPAPALPALVLGQTVFVRINATNTAAATLNVNALGARSIFSLLTGAAVVAGDLRINAIIKMTYDGTNWLAEIPPQYYTATTLNCGGSITVNNSTTCANITAATVQAGDLVQCSPSADPGAAKVTWSALATAGNISIRMDCNNNTAACGLTSVNWKCIVFK